MRPFSIKPALNCLPRVADDRENPAPVDNIRGKKDRIIDGEVVKKDDGDG
jgi:hypothetical protein